MKKISLILLGFCLLLTASSCFKDRDDEVQPASDLEINDFIWKAMNIWYLYKPNVAVLADDAFETDEEYTAFLNSYDSPESFFYDGLVDQNNDRFSFITDDYIELENSFAGVTLQNGIDFTLRLQPGSSVNVMAVVRYVVPGSPADQAGIERGDIFNKIDGQQLTATGNSLSNASRVLLSQDSYTIELATYNGSTVQSTGETIDLNKVELTENPILVAKTLDVNGEKIGYLMYNSFTANFDKQLNDAFAEFKSNGVTDLVLDLRYNGGGSVRTATDLAAMITGQFDGEIFSTEVWNPQIQEIFRQQDPETLNNRFNTKIKTGEDINSLELGRVFIIATGSSASASELVINGLTPYIDVTQIGTTTVGKFQASTTFYDSEAPNFQRNDANPNHTYAIQPLIFTSANAAGTTGFVNGIDPDVEVEENVFDLGTLGDVNEPLLAAALNEITSTRSFTIQREDFKVLPAVGEKGMENPTYQRMYVDGVKK